MQVIALFSGQGAQKVGMGEDLYSSSAAAKALIEQADSTLEINLQEVMFGGPEQTLTRTAYCQPALYTHGLAALAALREQVPSLELIASAGLSLGEFTAHAAAGTFSFEQGLQLVAFRGAAMERACEKTSGGMAAMIGGDEAKVIELAQEVDVDVANFNAPGQIVLSGEAANIEQACAKAADFGIRRAVPLPVAGAYHSRLMASAQEELATELAQATFREAPIPIYANVRGEAVAGSEAITSALTEQVTGSVRWVACMEAALSQFGEEVTFVEFGPDQTLAGLMRKIRKGVKVLSVSNLETLETVASQISQS